MAPTSADGQQQQQPPQQEQRQRRGSLQEQQEHRQRDHKKLSACYKLAFAVGGIPSPLVGIITTFYLNPFLLEVARVRPASVGVIIMVGRCIDAMTNPLVGVATWASLSLSVHFHRHVLNPSYNRI